MSGPEKIPVPPTLRRAGRLTSAKDARRFLARLARESYAGTFDPARAAKIAYVASVLIRCIEVEQVRELEGRITELEARK